MKISRRVTYNNFDPRRDGGFQVGDQIKIKIDGKKRKATAIYTDTRGNGLFLLNKCAARLPINKSGGTEGGYEKSDLRQYLRKLQSTIPKEWRDRMIPRDDDLLFLLSSDEVFGRDGRGRYVYFKNPAHMATHVPGEDYCANWWLRDVAGATYFAIVTGHGVADAAHSSNPRGVRPAFWLSSDLPSPGGCPEKEGKHDD